MLGQQDGTWGVEKRFHLQAVFSIIHEYQILPLDKKRKGEKKETKGQAAHIGPLPLTGFLFVFFFPKPIT